MKKLFLTVIIAMCGFVMNAQELEGGINVALPIGDAGDVADFSVGVDLAYLWDVGEDFDAGIATGFTNAFTKDITVLGQTVETNDVQFVPIAATARYSVSGSLFLGADVGYAVGINDGNDGGFYYRPKVGYDVSENISLNLSYTGVSVDGGSWDTIGLGVMFGL